MSSITETFSAATKSQLEAQFQILNTLANAAVSSAGKVIALNLSTTKASMEKSSAAAKKLLTATDPKEFFSLGTAEPVNMDNLLAYSRALYSIASAAQSELIQSAQSGLRQVAPVAPAVPAAKVEAVTEPAALPLTPPALAAAVSAAVQAVDESLADEAPQIPAPPHPVTAPVDIEEAAPVEIKAQVRPPFPEPSTKPIALSASETKPAKPKTRK